MSPLTQVQYRPALDQHHSLNNNDKNEQGWLLANSSSSSSALLSSPSTSHEDTGLLGYMDPGLEGQGWSREVQVISIRADTNVAGGTFQLAIDLPGLNQVGW